MLSREARFGGPEPSIGDVTMQTRHGAQCLAWVVAGLVAASRDADLLAEARKATLEIDPVPGSELQDLVDQVAASPTEVLDLVRKVSAR